MIKYLDIVSFGGIAICSHRNIDHIADTEVPSTAMITTIENKVGPLEQNEWKLIHIFNYYTRHNRRPRIRPCVESFVCTFSLTGERSQEKLNTNLMEFFFLHSLTPHLKLGVLVTCYIIYGTPSQVTLNGSQEKHHLTIFDNLVKFQLLYEERENTIGIPSDIPSFHALIISSYPRKTRTTDA